MVLNDVNKWFSDNGDYTLRLNYDLNENSIVFDLGGYQGWFAENIYKKFNCYVYVFEPYTPFFENIESKFKNNKKIKVFNYGIYDQTSDVSFIPLNEGSSVANLNEKNNIDKNFDTVKVKSFKDVYDELSIDFIDLIKINVEGSEYRIFNNIFENGYVNKIKNFQVQFHKEFPDSEKFLYEIRKELSKTHKQDWSYEWVWENWSLK